jgi:photosystem II stability/assembly factor-like uncharacterized protein
LRIVLIYCRFNVTKFKGVQKMIFSSRFSTFRRTIVLFFAIALLLGVTDSAFAQTKQRASKRSKNFKITKVAKSTSARQIRQPQTQDAFEGDPEKRDEEFLKERMFPFNKIPENARLNAWANRPADASRDSLSVAQWTSIGPRSVNSAFPNNWGLTSGRINAVAVSPTDSNLILVGASTGGIWRSTDGGTNFSAVSDSQVDLAVGSIAFAPSNPSIVYAGMGDGDGGYFGSGVLKSTDGGLNWVRVNNASLPTPGRASAILVDPTNVNRVYLSQYAFRTGNNSFASGFFFSNDGGVSWTKTISGLPRGMVLHPTQTGTIYLAMQRIDSLSPTTGGIMRSTDSGVTWTRVYTSPFTTTSNIKVAVTPANANNLYVLVGSTTAPASARVEVSTDNAATWTNKGSAFDIGQMGYNFYLFVNPIDVNTFYVGTRDMWRSTDGGTTYTNITNNFSITGSYNPFSARSHPDQHHFYISPTTPTTMYVANDGGLWRSTNNASTFQSLNATLSLSQFIGLSLHPTDPTRTYGGTQDNGTQKRTGPASWREFSSGDGGQTVIDPINPSNVYSTYVFGTIDRWSNNGETYVQAIGNQFGSDRVAFYPPFTGNGVNSNIYFGTYRLYISTNQGLTWTTTATDNTFGSGVLSAIGVGKSDTNIIYTGATDGRVMHSADNGATWTDRTAGLPLRTVKSIVVSPTNGNTAFVTLSGFDSGHVFQTTNSGATWTDISGNLPNIPTNTLLIDPRVGQGNTLYVGTDIGVFRSTNNGTTWENFNNGIPPVIITELDAQTGGLMQASTYGRGMYEINLNATRKPFIDFDGDTKTDISVFRPSVGEWYYIRSADGQVRGAQFGSATDKPVPADYTGDGKTDYAFFRPSTGEWFVIRSEDSSFYAFPFGNSTDIPTPGDFDGDGKEDAAVFRPSTGVWYVSRSTGGVTIQQFGTNNDLPVVADYDGDGKSDFAIYRPSLGEWYASRSTAGIVGAQFGRQGRFRVFPTFNRTMVRAKK